MRALLIVVLLSVLTGGCSLLYEKGEAPTKEVKIFKTGEKAEYDLILDTYTVLYKNGNVMFRATGWNGSNGFPMRWAPTFREVIDKRILLTDKGYIFDYGMKGGRKVPWGAWDKYEGWFEDGKKKYEYSYRSQKMIEWDDAGKVIKEMNQADRPGNETSY